MSYRPLAEYNGKAMIRKLAEELATNDLVLGSNDIRPQEEPNPPAAKATADHASLEHGWTPHANATNNQDQAGVLSRTLKGYKDESRQYNNILATHLGEHVRKLTGSPSMSRSAVQRTKATRGD